MRLVALSLGSNINREDNIRYAIKEIAHRFGDVDVSPVYETSAVGFDGPPFYNLVVAIRTDLDLPEIIEVLRAIESGAGRIRGPKTFDSRVLDIDVILYGDENWRDRGFNVPRDEIERYAYVLKPLADLYPDLPHPLLGLSIAEMWQQFDSRDQSLIVADFPIPEAT